MKPRTKKSMELYELMIKRGYPEVFCEQITLNLNTDWTAQRMIGYFRRNSPPECFSGHSGVSHYEKLRLEDIADEMLAILSDRNRIMKKHDLEEVNAKWNRYLNEGFGEDED